MPRKPRVDYEGAWHHVMNRGARRAPIFKSDDHRFIEVLEETHERFGLEFHAYALMTNHYHLLVRSPLGNPRERCAILVPARPSSSIAPTHGTDPCFGGDFAISCSKTPDMY